LDVGLCAVFYQDLYSFRFAVVSTLHEWRFARQVLHIEIDSRPQKEIENAKVNLTLKQNLVDVVGALCQDGLHIGRCTKLHASDRIVNRVEHGKRRWKRSCLAARRNNIRQRNALERAEGHLATGSPNIFGKFFS